MASNENVGYIPLSVFRAYQQQQQQQQRKKNEERSVDRSSQISVNSNSQMMGSNFSLKHFDFTQHQASPSHQEEDNQESEAGSADDEHNEEETIMQPQDISQVLISEVQSLPVLWDKASSEYKQSHKKKLAWMKVSKTIGLTGKTNPGKYCKNLCVQFNVQYFRFIH